jgi:hypothetical protein
MSIKCWLTKSNIKKIRLFSFDLEILISQGNKVEVLPETLGVLHIPWNFQASLFGLEVDD